MAALSARLRDVIICCGDWNRVCTQGALSQGNTVGIFLDPPYDVDHREDGLYSSDYDERMAHISRDVREWCIANGDNPRYRIVLAGYEGEHEMPDTWREYAWTANRAYGNSRGDTKKQRKSAAGAVVVQSALHRVAAEVVMRSFHRVDSVHAGIRAAARAAGYGWIDTYRQGDGCPDAFVLSRGGRWLALEIKSHGGKLTDAELHLWTSLPANAPWAMVESFDDLQKILEALDAERLD